MRMNMHWVMPHLSNSWIICLYIIRIVTGWGPYPKYAHGSTTVAGVLGVGLPSRLEFKV